MLLKQGNPAPAINAQSASAAVAIDPTALQTADRHRAPARHLGWRILKNTLALAVGSNLAALGRLVVLAMIARGYGISVFGSYSLLIAILAIADGVLDFGTTEVFVREVSREPHRRRRLLGILTATKLLQVPIAFAALASILLLLNYPPEVLHAGLLAGAGLLCYAAILVYRVLFRAQLTMEREVGAELASVLLMILLVPLAMRHGGGLVMLLGCHLASRAFFSALCVLFGSRQYVPSLRGVAAADLRWAFASSAVIGFAGFLVVAYQSLDLLLISKLASDADLAYYSAGQKLAWPLLMGLAAVGGTLYSVTSSHWPHDRPRFEAACQRGVDATFLLGGLGLCPMIAGSVFLMGLLGQQFSDGAAVLQVLAALCLVKAVSMTVGPTLFVVGAQKQVLLCIGLATLAKLLFLAAVARPFGYLGVGWGALAVELLFVTVPSVILVRRYAGFRFRWRVPLQTMGLTVVASLGALWVFPAGNVWSATAAVVLYGSLVLLTGAARVSDLRSLLRRT